MDVVGRAFLSSYAASNLKVTSLQISQREINVTSTSTHQFLHVCSVWTKAQPRTKTMAQTRATESRNTWTSLPKYIDNQARMCYCMIERVSAFLSPLTVKKRPYLAQAREAYRQGDFISYRAQCLEILQNALLPNYARIKALQLMSGAVPLAQSLSYLDQAITICDEIERREGEVFTVQEFRQGDGRLRAATEAEMPEKVETRLRW